MSKLYPRSLCEGCPLVPECLAYALRLPQAGIWGGTTEQERLAVLRRRQRAVVSTAEDAGPVEDQDHRQSQQKAAA